MLYSYVWFGNTLCLPVSIIYKRNTNKQILISLLKRLFIMNSTHWPKQVAVQAVSMVIALHPAVAFHQLHKAVTVTQSPANSPHDIYSIQNISKCVLDIY